MPELPEVQTIVNGLLPHIIGRSITDVDILWEKSIKCPATGEFRALLSGAKVEGLERRGKYFIFSLSNGYRLIIHLRMSGTLLLRRPDDGPDRYARVVFHLDDGGELRFCDVRKLGTIYLVADEKSVIRNMGPEPLDAAFTPSVLREQLAGRTAPIKATLCDQKVVAGIGNMYADEILHIAGIHPLTRTCELSDGEIEKIHEATIDVLHSAIENKGATVSDYVNSSGEAGRAQDHFRVAHRYKEPCPDCGKEITRIKVRGRGTYFCHECQPEV